MATKTTKAAVKKTTKTKSSSRQVQTITKAATKTKPATVAPKTFGLTVQAFDITGKSTGTVALPKEIFGQTPNEKLLAQAIRVYSANEKPHTAHTKTRGKVRGGGRKPWRQKGTGRARAGSNRSPLWVGGGITFGPLHNEAKLKLPQKMKHKALIYALSSKANSGAIKIITNLEKVPSKTKSVAALLKKLESTNKVLLISATKNENVKLASRNIKEVTYDTPQNLNAYQVLKARNLLISKDAISQFKP